ncbi:hypothetical protein BJ973_008047 [Actinoplanes tereljensis]|uniref:Uncharacterized protein n=1 Tax=Paractinoplanes tereljensis TaxID=571912 RepID=A0A919NUH7_9ACTN|nr:hypothetical protein [Actinoplanes tereljensis]GIF24568.1 hypothetical protein Ate02nite_72980 [Actinoplanes tereljensis]
MKPSDSAVREPGGDPSGHIELRPDDHEEPTWEVRPVRAQRRPRLNRRTRAILSAAAAAAVVVNAGAAWVYWQITGSETGQTGDGTAIELALRARSDLNRPMLRGQEGNLTVTVTNDFDFPIRITAITAGAGNVVADTEHRDAGCRDARVEITRDRFPVSWEVPRNTIGAFTIPGALSLASDAAEVCSGAIFTVPIQASGVRLAATD